MAASSCTNGASPEDRCLGPQRSRVWIPTPLSCRALDTVLIAVCDQEQSILSNLGWSGAVLYLTDGCLFLFIGHLRFILCQLPVCILCLFLKICIFSYCLIKLFTYQQHCIFANSLSAHPSPQSSSSINFNVLLINTYCFCIISEYVCMLRTSTTTPSHNFSLYRLCYCLYDFSFLTLKYLAIWNSLWGEEGTYTVL
jgi:hypothetical protein